MIRLREVAFSLLAVFALSLSAGQAPVWCQEMVMWERVDTKQEPAGDRIRMRLDSATLSADLGSAAVGVEADYEIGPGDVLAIYVTGKGNLNYHVGNALPEGPSERGDLDRTTVTPSGDVILPLLGPVRAAGLTPDQLAEVISDKLVRYYKDVNVSVTLSKPRIMKIWVNGDVENPGPQVIPGTATVLEALLKAGIGPTGSTRQIRLQRGDQSIRVDAYAIIMAGALDQNLSLQPGDSLFVPVAKGVVDVTGEVVRPGKFEALCFAGKRCRVSDAVELAMGFLPAAVPGRGTLERKDGHGDMITTHLDLDRICSTPDCDENVVLLDGDRIRVPSISEFQAAIRMVGEFIGEDVYQRTLGQREEQVLNKSGVYRLSLGETAGDVIRKTGGWTPQADLKRARIERQTKEGMQTLALDLERVLIENDPSSDAVLKNGDTLVLPAIVDKVQILGQVARPGAYSYAPGRKLLEYVGEAGGPLPKASFSRGMIIRPDGEGSRIVKRGLGTAEKDNPVLDPGDVVLIPESAIRDWRDILPFLTTYRLLQTLF